jgi:hypothetical protein
MRARFEVAVLAAGLFVAACGPSIDPAARADVDRRASELRPGAEAFGAPAAPSPMALGVGQWATYKAVDNNGRPSFVTMKIVGEQAGAFWYETLQESYYGRQGLRMLVDFGDRRRPESLKIKSAKIRDTKGRVTEYPEELIGFMNSMLRGQMGPITVDWTGLPQEDAAVPAGRFVSCYKGRSEVSWAGMHSVSTAWGHPTVPISGMVRSVGDNGMTMDLVAFGTSGAQSDF